MSLKRSLDTALNKTTERLRLILGDQLNPSHSWFKSTEAKHVYLIAELKQETSYVKHHTQKVAAFFKAMENFAKALANAGHQVIYLTLDETKNYKNLNDLLNKILTKNNLSKFDYQQPDEYRLHKQLNDFRPKNVDVTCYSSEHFLLSFDEINQRFEANQHVKMEYFYRQMRKEFNLLMEDNSPVGGQWNFDKDNRASFKTKDLASIPKPMMFDNSVASILERIDHHNIETFGDCNNTIGWPVSRKQSRQLLSYFCRYLLPKFGRFQDAMTEQSEHAWSLYHSRLSFALNSKMLSPIEVINYAIEHWENHKEDISISQIEGFVRQILGWREYVRAIYWVNMPDYASKNKLLAQRKLPSYFWTAKTGMNCLKQTIGQSLEYAYAHHIQRLMITGNFCLLTGIHPDQVDEWYLGIYIDAIEWVEMPNTRGMTQFADHGIIATKPYCASGSYINKMSDYCKSCQYKVNRKTESDACPFNSLYWHFLHRNKEKLGNNHRLTMIYNVWSKMSESKQQALLERADWCLEHMDEL